jgi:hypothetical protein
MRRASQLLRLQRSSAVAALGRGAFRWLVSVGPLEVPNKRLSYSKCAIAASSIYLSCTLMYLSPTVP